MITGNDKYSDQLSPIDKLPTPKHLRRPRVEAFSPAWYDRCNEEFVRAMREHHPERELTLWRKPAPAHQAETAVPHKSRRGPRPK